MAFGQTKGSSQFRSHLVIDMLTIITTCIDTVYSRYVSSFCFDGGGGGGSESESACSKL